MTASAGASSSCGGGQGQPGQGVFHGIGSRKCPFVVRSGDRSEGLLKRESRWWGRGALPLYGMRLRSPKACNCDSRLMRRRFLVRKDGVRRPAEPSLSLSRRPGWTPKISWTTRAAGASASIARRLKLATLAWGTCQTAPPLATQSWQPSGRLARHGAPAPWAQGPP